MGKYKIITIVLALGALTAAGLLKNDFGNANQRINKAADYIVRHQNPDGLFDYEYDINLNNYSSANNIVRQIGTSYALAQAANYFHKKIYFDSSKNAVDHLVAMTHVRVVGGKRFRFLPYQEKISTNANALLILAILELAKADQKLFDSYSEVLEELASHVLAAQNEDGLFWNLYDEKQNRYTAKQSDYTNGESLLALVELYKMQPSQEYLLAATIAANANLKYYSDEWNRAFYAWGVRGMAGLYGIVPINAYKDFVFDLSDKMLKTDYFTGDTAKISLGVFIEGLAPVYELAKLKKDQKRAETYKKAIEFGVSKLLKLQISEHDVLSSQIFENARGGFCSNITCKKIRIDNVQHGMAAMIAVNRSGL